MRVLYADILFLINFCMDFFTLYLTGKLLHIQIRNAALLISATLGALYSVFSVLYSGSGVVALFIDLAVAVILSTISYYSVNNPRTLGKIILLFYTLSLLMGGLITFMYSMLNRLIGYSDSAESKGMLRVAVFFLLAGISALCVNISSHILNKAVKSKSVFLKVYLDNKAVSFDALVDSGNLLTDPISKRVVIVVSLSSIETILPFDIRRIVRSNCYDLSDISVHSAKRIRLIPTKSIAGSKTLIGLLPDKIEVTEKDKKSYRVDAIIALDAGQKHRYAGYGAVMPASLIC